MKRCPTCNRTYTDPALNFCLEDGTPLAADNATTAPDLNATVRYPSARDTSEPPPTEIYRPQQPAPSPRPAPPPPPPPTPQTPPQWAPPPVSPMPTMAPRKKSNAIWWILGAFAAVAVIGVGLVVMFIVLASLSNSNTNLNANTRNENRNSNLAVNANISNSNTNAIVAPASLTDDFSEQKWGIGNSPYGRIWYDDGEYHMSSKERTFVVMYAPSDAYNTENATVKVTARSVDGEAPSAGFGLMVHCAQSKAKQLEDYALLIYPTDEPEYEIIKHKDGNQSAVVTKTKSSAIHSGSTPNTLEIRIQGTQLTFYVNGQYLTRITDTENFRRGRAGLYTSDSHEVAFDDLSINRQSTNAN
jgi:hypothetical protein